MAPFEEVAAICGCDKSTKVVFKTITLDKINYSRYQQHVRKQNISASAFVMRSTLKTQL